MPYGVSNILLERILLKRFFIMIKIVYVKNTPLVAPGVREHQHHTLYVRAKIALTYSTEILIV